MNLPITIKIISSLCDKYRTLSAAEGSRYNIFRVINLTTEEERVHSAFIANLLNPKGEHGFNSTFLKLFIDHIEVSNFDVESASVRVEKDIGAVTVATGGRVDIDIWDKDGNHIIIENKINAEDGDNQLVRYHSYGQTCNNFKLLYLTLDGSLPNENKSCTNKLTGYKLEVDKDYHLLSYSFDIKIWLEKCREKSATKPLLREAISHYLNLIKHLTSNTMTDALKEEVKKELLNKDNIKNLSLLKESIIVAEKSLQQQFWDKLKNKFIEAGYKITLDNVDERIEKYYSTTKNNKYYGFEVLIIADEVSPVTYGVRVSKWVYGGFTIHREGKNNVNQETEYSNYRDHIKQINSEYAVDDVHWLGWKWLSPHLNFGAIDEDTCLHLSNMEETLNSMFSDIDKDIKQFKAYLNKP